MEVEVGAELCFPLLLNTSCRKPASPWPEAVLLHIVLSSISLLTVALNLLVIVSISHFRQLHTPTNILLLSLAVSDFLVGLLKIYVFVVDLLLGWVKILLEHSCWFLGDLMCSLYNYVPSSLSLTSVGDMVLISVDRYVANFDPLHYTTRVTERRVKLYITPVMENFCVAVSQARAMRSHITAVTLQRSVAVTTKKSELKAGQDLGVLVVVFLMCFSHIMVFLLQDDFLTPSTSNVL
uniref:G-protein coupled receptors family 1 profile domain-containing protein n=1 Tax=Seriola dumerili TaxID=41447 RepID=A0A3B4UIN0_SERDU